MTLLLKACSSTTMKSSLVPRLKFLVEELGADCTTVDFKGNNAVSIYNFLCFLVKFNDLQKLDICVVTSFGWTLFEQGLERIFNGMHSCLHVL
jgi:hypothetical protein